MCYLKNLYIEEDQEFNLWEQKQSEISQPTKSEANVLVPCLEKRMGSFFNDGQQNFVRIFQLIQQNNHFISKINKLILENSQQVQKITIKTENQSQSSTGNIQAGNGPRRVYQKESRANGSLIKKLFGDKIYSYCFETREKFPEMVYKERNFNVGLKLVDKTNKQVRNGNLLTLCFGVCTSDGEWIYENRVGQPFMKGKTQIQLYKGQAIFQKLHVREVSKIYPGGKINVVIYAKPTILKYLVKGQNQQQIKSEEIEPLIIENVCIRAKKKQ